MRRNYGLFFDIKTDEGVKPKQFDPKNRVYATEQYGDLALTTAMHEARELNRKLGRPKLYVRRIDKLTDEQWLDMQL
jgi:hypothetical protein